MADRLAKSFYQHVVRAVGPEEKVLKKQFREGGLLDFVNLERPETDDPAEMAGAAVLYLGIGSHGELGPLGRKVVQAAISFMFQHHEKRPTRGELAALGEILEQTPIDRDKVAVWFRATYPKSL